MSSCPNRLRQVVTQPAVALLRFDVMDKLVPRDQLVLRNRLLLALPRPNLQLIASELQQIPCERGQVLMDIEDAIDRVIFPDSGVVSIVAVYADGNMIEMATTGREGCAPVNAILGATVCSARLIVQIPGSATVMPRDDFVRAMRSMPEFRSIMLAYVQAFLEQIQVSVACNGTHSLKSRLARWLLMMRDRADGDVLHITQDLLGEVLGVHRPSVTNAVRELERAGLIERGRRQVIIRDRGGLVRAACECYRLVREHIVANLPRTYA